MIKQIFKSNDSINLAAFNLNRFFNNLKTVVYKQKYFRDYLEYEIKNFIIQNKLEDLITFLILLMIKLKY